MYVFLPSLQGHLNTYRFCDNVWTFVLENVDFREVGEIVKAEKVKVVACDGKGMVHKTNKYELIVVPQSASSSTESKSEAHSYYL
jgi:hypothetical protein